MEENIFSIVDIIVKEILISCAKIWCGFYVNLDGFWFYFPYFDHLAHLCTFIKEELKLSISSYKQSRWIAMVCVEHDVDIENLRNWDRKTTTVKTFLVNMMTKMMKLVMNLENPWSPLSSGERCKCEGHFSDELWSERWPRWWAKGSRSPKCDLEVPIIHLGNSYLIGKS